MIIAAFSEDQASRLTGITVSQLRYWDRTGFFSPAYADPNRRAAFSRVYSFRDIVSLRVLNVLRNQYSVSLRHLRDVSEKLAHLAEDRWTSARLYVLNKRVHWIEPETAQPQEVVSGQYLSLDIAHVIQTTTAEILKFAPRDASKHGEIAKSRYVNHNAEVIAGTRVPVIAIKRFAAAGFSVEQILQEYPDLTERDIKAALEYSEPRAAA